MPNEVWGPTLICLAIVIVFFLVKLYQKYPGTDIDTDEPIEYDREGIGQEFPKTNSLDKKFGTSENHHHRST